MKLLYFYPEFPLQASQGNSIRVIALLDYFKSRGHQVDFVCEAPENKQGEMLEELKKSELVSNCYFLRNYQKKKHKLGYLFQISIPNLLHGRMRQFYRVKPGQQKDFNRILQDKHYDLILISYACWSGLIADNPFTGKAQLWLDTHDFLTAQFQSTRGFDLGKSMETEIKLLGLFDKILVISPEEQYVFSQFIKKPIEVVTHSIPNASKYISESIDYDFIFVGSDNQHNIQSIQWFFNHVYPLLPKTARFIIIGKITDFVAEYPNVTKVRFAPSLQVYYQKAKIALCPMVSGTGLKIKVVEALSYGLPVVCQPRSIDGLWNKSENGCLVANEPELFASHCIQLLNDEPFYNYHCEQSRTYFKNHHDTQKIYQELDRIFENYEKET